MRSYLERDAVRLSVSVVWTSHSDSASKRLNIPSLWHVLPGIAPRFLFSKSVTPLWNSDPNRGLTLWRPLLPYGYNYKSILRQTGLSCRLSSFVIFDIWALWRSRLNVRVPRCKKVTNDGLTRSGTGCSYSCTHMASMGVKGLKVCYTGLLCCENVSFSPCMTDRVVNSDWPRCINSPCRQVL